MACYGTARTYGEPVGAENPSSSKGTLRRHSRSRSRRHPRSDLAGIRAVTPATTTAVDTQTFRSMRLRVMPGVGKPSPSDIDHSRGSRDSGHPLAQKNRQGAPEATSAAERSLTSVHFNRPVDRAHFSTSRRLQILPACSSATAFGKLRSERTI